MKLKELFDKYPDECLAKMKSRPWMPKTDIGWLKDLSKWANNESRQLGYEIPQFMIDYAEADDWEIYEE